MPQLYNASLVSHLEPFFVRRGERINSEAVEFDDIKVVSPTGGTVKIAYEKFGQTSQGSLTVDSDGTLDIVTTQDLKFTPSSNAVIPGGASVSIGTRNDRFVATEVVDTKVGRIVPGDTVSGLPGSLIVAVAVTYLIHELREYEILMQVADAVLGDTTGQEGDFIRMEYGGTVEWMEILVHDDPETGKIYKAVTGGYEYKVTRDLASAGPGYWLAGDTVINTGQDADGFVEVHARESIDGDAGPSVRIYQRPTSSTYAQYPVHALLGNLIGAYGYVANTFGAGMGKESSDHIVIDPTNGIRFRDGSNNVLAQLTSAAWTLGLVTDDHITIDTTNGIRFLDGTGDVHAQLNATVWTIGLEEAGGNVRIQAGEISLRNVSTETITIEADGDVFVGSNLSAAATTFLSIFANNQTYNGEAVTAGDMLIGNNTAGKGNVLYDHSAGQLLFRSGPTTNIYVDTTGSLVAGDVTIDSGGITVDAANQLVFQVSGTDVGIIGGDAGGYSPHNGIHVETNGASGSVFEVVVKSGGTPVNALVIESLSSSPYIHIEHGSTEVMSILAGGFWFGLATSIWSHAAGEEALIIKGYSGQTESILRVQQDGPTTVVSVDANGTLYVDNNTSGATPFIVDAHASQSVNIAEFRSSAGADLVSINSNGGVYIDNAVTTNVPLVIDAAGSQSANLLNLRDSAGNVLASFNSGGSLYIDTPSAAFTPLIIDAAASQSANLVEIRDSSGNDLVVIGDGGSLYMPVTTLATNPITIDDSHYFVLCNTGITSITVNLPAAASSVGRQLWFKKVHASNTLTLDGNSGDLVEGAATFAWTQDDRAYGIMCDGTDWHIIGSKL